MTEPKDDTVGLIKEAAAERAALQTSLAAVRDHVESQIDDLQQQLNRRIETQHRELDAAKERFADALEAADRRLSADALRVDGVPLREYVEALFEESKRQREIADAEREKAAQQLRTARETADQEREKAAASLRDEQYRAMQQAEREREKAAEALRMGLDRAIREGDDRLREHILQQVQQIQAALDSAERLEVERFDGAKVNAENVRRELLLISNASVEAVKKAETSQENINKQQSEFRSQLADLVGTLMPRKEAESRTGELDRRVQLLERGESGARATATTTERQQDRIQPWQIWIAGAVITIIITLIVVLANVLSAA